MAEVEPIRQGAGTAPREQPVSLRPSPEFCTRFHSGQLALSGNAVPVDPVSAAPVRCERSTDYAMTPGVVRLTRAWSRRQLREMRWDGDVDDVVVIVSELVTNAVQHATRSGGLLALRLAVLADEGLLIEVSDPVSGFPRFSELLAARAGAEAECGRGLALVRLLGARLSWHLAPEQGKTVRAHVVVS